MEYITPTTKQEMYQALKEIFYYYRIRKDSYEDFILPELTLERMSVPILTAEELRAQAQTILAPKFLKERADFTYKINTRKLEITEELKALESKRAVLISSCETEYQNAIKTANQEAQIKGLSYSSALSGKLFEIEIAYTNKINEINQSIETEREKLNAETAMLNLKLESIEDYFGATELAEINAKVLELQKEQEKAEKEAFKYNNTIEEKCQRYKGTVATTNATLRLRYLDINTEFFSKDQLIEMGYYEDVIACVCAYYNTLPALQAYQDIVNETKIAVYLDDFYQDVIFMFKSRLNN